MCWYWTSDEQGWFTWTMPVQHSTQRHRWRMLPKTLCRMSTEIPVSLNLEFVFTRDIAVFLFVDSHLLRKLLWLCSLTCFLDSQSDSSMATSDLVTSMRHQVLHIIKIPDLPVLVFVFSIICKLIYIQCKESTLKINRCCNSFVGKRTPMLVIGIHYLFYARHLTIFMSVSAYRLK